jgi:hypothetical protein
MHSPLVRRLPRRPAAVSALSPVSSIPAVSSIPSVSALPARSAGTLSAGASVRRRAATAMRAVACSSRPQSGAFIRIEQQFVRPGLQARLMTDGNPGWS